MEATRDSPPVESQGRRGSVPVLATSALATGVVSAVGLNQPPFTEALPLYAGACSRLAEVGMGPTARDWFCFYAPRGIHPGAVISAGLLGLGLLLPGVILAASGRRASALLPLGAFIARSGQVLNLWWGPPALQRHPLMVDLIVFLVLSCPAIALMLARRSRPVFRPAAPPFKAIGAALICLVFAAAVSLPWGFFGQWRAIGSDWSSYMRLGFGIVPASTWQASLPLSGAAALMALFGALLGRGRRWMTSSFVPVALLVSQGVPALAWHWDRRSSGWEYLTAAFPLFVIAVICSAWRPLAGLLSHGTSVASSPRERIGARRSRMSALQVAGALVISGSLSVAMLGYGVRVSIALPTYLSQRTAAQDARTMLDLRQALLDMNTYYGRHHTYEGFDLAVARRIDPTLSWWYGYFPSGGPPPGLTIAIIPGPSSEARVAAMSYSGNAFCIEQRKGSQIHFGESPPTPSQAYSFGYQPVGAAVERCGSRPWSVTLTRAPNLSCDGISILCRMVQVLIHETMLAPKPTPAAPGPQRCFSGEAPPERVGLQAAYTTMAGGASSASGSWVLTSRASGLASLLGADRPIAGPRFVIILHAQFTRMPSATSQTGPGVPLRRSTIILTVDPATGKVSSLSGFRQVPRSVAALGGFHPFGIRLYSPSCNSSA